ncbi:hypothetical protein [Spiroplasma cantharicola]|uniref:Holliday junction DNA helicase RuvA n=1 Tax=Spiroplasma cantharicola TaxID=362837 RepID=A0A0M4JJL1_9MOLU|nr:hypothetical protein [Spiroplasma cantharicola]ALD66399.1 Holliday junction DNA helicase RuvA [Spiroplasma cantharicola]
MYCLEGYILEQDEECLLLKVNQIGYKGFKIFKENFALNKLKLLYVINYKNEYSNDLLFFESKKVRDLSELILNIKNIGISTIKKIFKNVSEENFIKICKEQDINTLNKISNLSESICKKVINEIRFKLFNEKYNLKQMNVINSLNKLGYKLSDIYKSIQNIDLNLSEEILLSKAILNLNNYGN